MRKEQQQNFQNKEVLKKKSYLHRTISISKLNLHLNKSVTNH